jgi:hypothetical protein
MTIFVTQAQNEALAMLNVALYKATNSGLLDMLSDELHPDVINRFCDSVGALCKEAQVSADPALVPRAPALVQNEAVAQKHTAPKGFGPDSHCSISCGQATLPEGTVVDLLKVQAAVNYGFQELGASEFSEATQELEKLTGMWQGPHADFYPNGVEAVEAN